VTPPPIVSEATWVLLKFAYLALRRSINLLVLLARGNAAKGLGLLVLRHQLTMLRGQVPRPKFESAGRVRPRSRWSCLLVKPETLLRWHRRLVAGAWTYRLTDPAGRPSTRTCSV
jgi:hypothetical protein